MPLGNCICGNALEGGGPNERSGPTSIPARGSTRAGRTASIDLNAPTADFVV